MSRKRKGAKAKSPASKKTKLEEGKLKVVKVGAARPAPAPAPARPAFDLPDGVVGKRGHPAYGADLIVLRLQADLDSGDSYTCYVHDDESVKSVTDSSLSDEERVANVSAKAKFKGSATA